jgi:hypothetical protein
MDEAHSKSARRGGFVWARGAPGGRKHGGSSARAVRPRYHLAAFEGVSWARAGEGVLPFRAAHPPCGRERAEGGGGIVRGMGCSFCR